MKLKRGIELYYVAKQLRDNGGICEEIACEECPFYHKRNVSGKNCAASKLAQGGFSGKDASLQQASAAYVDFIRMESIDLILSARFTGKCIGDCGNCVMAYEDGKPCKLSSDEFSLELKRFMEV